MRFEISEKIKLFSDSLITLLIIFSIICIAVLFSTQVINLHLDSEEQFIYSDINKGCFKNNVDESKKIIPAEIIFIFPSEEVWVKSSVNQISPARHTNIKNQ